MAIKPIPQGYHTITPYIVAKDAKKLITFLENAFAAKLLYKITGENGDIRHAQIQIGDSKLMLSEAMENYPATTTSLYLYVEDTDSVYKAAILAGGESIMEPRDMFYGDRNGGVKDHSGNQWWIATHIEDVTTEEIEKRSKEYCK